jgi:endonuclease YncB( thermonuclease family)
MRFSTLVYTLVVWSLLSPSELPAGTNGVVTAVVDAERIVVRQNGRDSIVRLIGIKVPESHRALASAALGTELTGQSVQIEIDTRALTHDEHGSRLAWVYRLPEGTQMNYQLVRLGLATIATEDGLLYGRELQAAQSAARLERRGLWNGVSPAMSWETQFRHLRYLGEMNYQPAGGSRTNPPLATAKESKPEKAAKVRITNKNKQ